MRNAAYLLAALLPALAPTLAGAAARPQYLAIEAKIPLPHVHGRFDHLAFDAKRNRLFVAALGNNSVEVVDVAARQVIRHIPNLSEPQGVAFSEALQMLYVACGGDGTLHAWHAADLSPAGAVKLGGDADNVRVDERARRVYVGFGDGAMAILQPEPLRVSSTISLKGHPESFQLSPVDDRLLVNVPDASQIAVLNRGQTQVVTTWSTLGMQANYPMVLDPDGKSAFVVFRKPAWISEFSTRDGRSLHATETCIDADDVFLDARRQRLYVVCGEGVVDTLVMNGLAHLSRTPTSAGARTGLFVPAADRLFVAARAEQGDAAIWVLKPVD
jgi:YVTN family beta-propeller protein